MVNLIKRIKKWMQREEVLLQLIMLIGFFLLPFILIAAAFMSVFGPKGEDWTKGKPND